MSNLDLALLTIYPSVLQRQASASDVISQAVDPRELRCMNPIGSEGRAQKVKADDNFIILKIIFSPFYESCSHTSQFYITYENV